jgi:hypothetical protein
MKVQATVVFTFQAKTLADAGAVMDDVLARARERDDVEVGGVEIVSPPGEHLVTLRAPTPGPRVRTVAPAITAGQERRVAIRCRLPRT